MRILLVDDEPINVESLANAIRRGGHTIVTMSNPLEALKAYREAPFDAVISDVRMPQMNGIDLLRSVRDFDPDARFILITGYGDARTAMGAINNRAWAMLGKPINIATMMDTLNAIERSLPPNSGNGTELDLSPGHDLS